jgi:hypothetical protein
MLPRVDLPELLLEVMSQMTLQDNGSPPLRKNTLYARIEG